MPNDLAERFPNTALAFRGYNITNLGRSAELLQHSTYGPTVKRYLKLASDICADVVERPIDLAQRLVDGREPTMDEYSEAVALVVATELAQIALLEQFFGLEMSQARLSFGYSLGELSAVTSAGIFAMQDVLRVPLAMSADSAELSHDVTMGVVFSRGPTLPEEDIQRLCLRINAEDRGVIGISSILSPNTFLLLGQRDTVARFGEIMHELLHARVHLRVNPHRWPPLHSPIIWQRNIPNRAAVMMHSLPGGFASPAPPIISLVTGKESYNDYNGRALLQQWIDHPQRLWDAVYETLSSGVNTVIHVGPEPNLIPATFKRLSDNVKEQVSGRSLGSLGLRAVSGMVRRPWLANLLPNRTALLRAPKIRHVILEDWLLKNGP